MLRAYTAKYTKISSGYMGQLVEWPEVVTEGKSIEECREMLQDARHEMITAYQQHNKEIPMGAPCWNRYPARFKRRSDVVISSSTLKQTVSTACAKVENTPSTQTTKIQYRSRDIAALIGSLQTSWIEA
jgi:predicted RNase H-like HicB family nuclease